MIDGFPSKQDQINLSKVRAAKNYPYLWSKIISEWGEDNGEDRAWLVYSANYLLRTGGIRWAVDPLTLKQRVPQSGALDTGHDLRQLSLVLLTHSHADHLDLNLLQTLKDLPIQWIIPEDIYHRVLQNTGITEARVIVPRHLEPISVEGMTILPFDGLHWEKQPLPAENPLRGVPSVAYLVAFNGKRWLFPGDTRTYDARQIPSLGPVDGVLAHVWLGRSSALIEPPPQLDQFCRFFRDLQPRRVVLTHLDELGRNAAEYWDDHHASMVMARWQCLAPEIPISKAKMGDSVKL